MSKEENRTPSAFPPRKRLIAAAVFAVAAAGAAFLYFHPPGEFKFYPGCLFFKLTGLYCPACGNTRALYRLLHGDLPGSLHMNPMLVPLLLLAALLFCKPELSRSRAVGWTAFWVVAAFWVLRNIPVFPFTLLAPGG